jgi:outer membrane protein
MKNLIKTGLLLIFLTITTFSTITAQKYGHLNSGNLIMSIPEAQAAEKELETYRNQLIAGLEKKGEALQADALKLQQEYDSGALSQVKAQEKQTALMKRGEDLRNEEVELGNQVAAKREELLKPILDKLDAALKEVGKEGGYTMIFDTGIFNALLYVEEGDDVLPLVKAKLGL